MSEILAMACNLFFNNPGKPMLSTCLYGVLPGSMLRCCTAVSERMQAFRESMAYFTFKIHSLGHVRAAPLQSNRVMRREAGGRG